MPSTGTSPAGGGQVLGRCSVGALASHLCVFWQAVRWADPYGGLALESRCAVCAAGCVGRCVRGDGVGVVVCAGRVVCAPSIQQRQQAAGLTACLPSAAHQSSPAGLRICVSTPPDSLTDAGSCDPAPAPFLMHASPWCLSLHKLQAPSFQSRHLKTAASLAGRQRPDGRNAKHRPCSCCTPQSSLYLFLLHRFCYNKYVSRESNTFSRPACCRQLAMYRRSPAHDAGPFLVAFPPRIARDAPAVVGAVGAVGGTSRAGSHALNGGRVGGWESRGQRVSSGGRRLWLGYLLTPFPASAPPTPTHPTHHANTLHTP